MHNKSKFKIILASIVLSLSINNANAGLFDIITQNKDLAVIGGATVVGAGLMSQSHNYQKILNDLVDQPAQTNSFFQHSPTYFNPIAQLLLKHLAQARTQEEYSRYRVVADIMGLDNIPPFSGGVVNGPSVYANPQQDQNRVDNILEHPIQEQPFSNIIHTPQGKKLDTSTEFPYETPKNWKEYLLLKQDSTILGENMVNSGQQRPDNTAAHHLISATSPDTKEARAILEKYLKNTTPVGEKTYNNEINGVYLPNIDNTDPNIPGILHNGRHPKVYNQAVNDMIVKADTQGGWPAVQQTLLDIKQNLLNANRTEQWKNMP